MPNDTTIAVRIDDDLSATLDELAAHLTKQTPGLRVTRSDVVRVALQRGTEVLAREHEARTKSKR